MRPARARGRPHLSDPRHTTTINNSADHEVESSNSTASLFLGGLRKSWMLDPSLPPHSNYHHHHPASSGSPPGSSDSRLPRPPSRLPASVSVPASSVYSFQRRPSTTRASSGPSRPTTVAAPLQDARSDSQPAVTDPPALEPALMSPVTPGETLLQHQYDAVPSQLPSDPSLPTTATATTTTTKPITPAIPTPATTAISATYGNNIPVFPTNQFSSLPSPDPSNPSHPSPSSAVDQPSQEPSCQAVPSAAAMPAQIQSQQPQPHNSPLAGGALLPAGVYAGGANAGVNQHQATNTAPQQQPRQEVAHMTQSPSQMPTPGPSNEAGPGAAELEIDDAFWASCQKNLESVVSQYARNPSSPESLEPPRLRLLRDACHSRDLLYLAFHQVYCFSTFAPHEFASLPGFSGKSTLGLGVLEQLLVDNHRLSNEFLKWCVHFPNAPEVMMKSPRYRSALKQVPQCLAFFHGHWASYDTSVRTRGYPPLIDELVVRFGVTSSVMLSIIFLAMCRRLYGNRHEMQLRHLFLQNKQNYDRRFAKGQCILPEQMQQENERLIQAYLALNQMRVNSPRAVPAASSLGSPQINSPQPVAAASHSSPFVATPPVLPAQQSPHIASHATMPVHGTQNQMRPAIVQTGVQHHSNRNTHVPAPGFYRQLPQIPPNSHARVPSNVASQPPSSQGVGTTPRTLSDRQVDAARYQHYNPHFMLIQQMFGNPPTRPVDMVPSPTTVNSPPISVPAPAPAATQQTAPLRPPQTRQNTTNVQTAARARADVGMTRQPWPSDAAVSSRDPVNVPFPSRLATPHTTLLPRPGWVPINTVRPNPLRVSLHQAHLRDPMLKMVHFGAAGEEETELFQYLQSFMVPPSPLGLMECAFQWQFSLSDSDCQRMPRVSSRGTGERSLRILSEGIQTYRFRCIKVPPSATELPGHEWSVADTTWPSLMYIFVNGVELYVRRKIHNGKDIPLDITDHLKSGVNTISMYVIRSPAESKDVFYVAGVEVLDIAGYDHVKNLAQTLPASESQAQIKQRLSSRAEDEELSIINDDLTVNLVDPFMARIFNIPARGIACAHRDCFDLDTFLMTRASKSGKGPMTENWKCPICGVDTRPQCLIIDGFLVEVHAELKRTNQLDDARAIQIKSDGSWELKVDKDAQAADESEERKTQDVPAKRKHQHPSSSASPLPQQRPKIEARTATPTSADIGRGSQPPVIELD